MSVLSVIKLTVAFLIGSIHYVTGTETREFCIQDDLDITCSYGDVIIIERATYGRMSRSKCIFSDNSMGCSMDVTTYVESWCSGRQHCTNQVNKLIKVANPCRRDLMGYLEVKYSCITVAAGTSDECMGSNSNKYVSLTDGNGYIAPYGNIKGTKYGSSSCPWFIQVNPGQRVNITLLDFNIFNKDLATSSSQSQDHYKKNCPLNVVVEENGQTTSQQVCVGHTKNRRIYVTSSNSVLINFEYLDPNSETIFLLHYSASGCENLVAPNFGWIISDSAKVQVRCNFTGEIWYLTCEDNAWIGEVGNCPSEAEALLLKSSNSSEFPFGLVVAVIIGIVLGVLIGVCLLGMVYVCRRGVNKNEQNRGSIYGQPNNGRDIDIYSDGMRGILPSIPKDQLTRGSDYGYFPTMPPKGHVGSPQHKQNAPYIHDGNRTAPRTHHSQPRSHIYESPTFANRIDNKSIPPVYHELDGDIGIPGRYTN